MWGATRPLAKMVAFVMQSQHVASEPGANSPDRASCLSQGRGHHFASAASHCVERSKEAKGAEMTVFFMLSHVGQIVWHRLLLAGKVLLASSQGSNPGSQAC